jgi:hypothetical protein
MTIFFLSLLQGFVSAGLLSVKQSWAGDCSGKSPNMHVTAAVRNMDWGERGFAKIFQSLGAPIYDLEKSLARVRGWAWMG